jgi:hypothetical protein
VGRVEPLEVIDVQEGHRERGVTHLALGTEIGEVREK